MPKGRVFKTKAKGAQEAHEAIRPTSFARDPDSLPGSLGHDEVRLYKLIWQRAIASQMAAKELETSSVDLEAGRYLLRATATRTVFDGFARAYTEGRDEGDEEEVERQLPPLSQGDEVAVSEVTPAIVIRQATLYNPSPARVIRTVIPAVAGRLPEWLREIRLFQLLTRPGDSVRGDLPKRSGKISPLEGGNFVVARAKSNHRHAESQSAEGDAGSETKVETGTRTLHPDFEATRVMRDRSDHARQENAGKHCKQHTVRRTICSLGLRGRQASNPMTQQRSRSRPQQVRFLWNRQLCQSGDQLGTARTRDDRVVTGELSEHRKAEAGQPNERVEPQSAQGKLVQEPDQVVAPPRMYDLVNQYRVELRSHSAAVLLLAEARYAGATLRRRREPRPWRIT